MRHKKQRFTPRSWCGQSRRSVSLGLDADSGHGMGLVRHLGPFVGVGLYPGPNPSLEVK